jgi:hypothetical protein
MLTTIDEAMSEPTRIFEMGALLNPELSMVADNLRAWRGRRKS